MRFPFDPELKARSDMEVGAIVFGIGFVLFAPVAVAMALDLSGALGMFVLATAVLGLLAGYSVGFLRGMARMRSIEEDRRREDRDLHEELRSAAPRSAMSTEERKIYDHMKAHLESRLHDCTDLC